MFNFDFYNPTRVLFGADRIADIGQHIPEDARVLITYGGGSAKKYGTLDEVKAAIGDRVTFEFGGIEVNPHLDTLMKAVDIVRENKVDFLLAVGGGSVVDGTKFIAAAALYEGDIWPLWSQRQPLSEALPLGCVMTLPATGSETNHVAVVTNTALGQKSGYSDPLLFPKFAVLDPTKTYTLPVTQVANGVVDAFIHVIEQYLTYPVYGKVQDRFAEGLLLTLIEEGPKALTDPQNYDVRSAITWSATLALNGLIAVGVPQDWATHRIGHQLTALYGIDHAQTLAILLPGLLQVQRESKKQKLLQYAERVWNIQTGDDDARIDAAIAKTREFFELMGLKTQLSAYGQPKTAIDEILDNLERFNMLPMGERQDIDLARAKEILTLSY
ncbi:iron-containing alcohol dehydrogenase [Rouxiella badensis]|jgi:NADP-dependent alcohol dehydrogenase|uniref:NADH-dependent alcohol dehydrogenase n=1 Tax=Rouxiella badensis TaxID=1646377 RepID=A0A1X0WI36_9GAMM|nr:iron-containing alcohol dehydrogenase [Rouxiella badensis]MCC3703391.1 iron-containing alcohol dehydrogenase [Rouxiella badensis]MCC3731814.1 iron-containing alcohol dehydrogenase [Rouxiella badensis]MCC3757203.1 iron-containing alcohol dehydrogenase [Rouxiella badensis]ORJ26394.1 NADH-dependent alcohol dehydrogenase [Rouxiella badensis]WAT10010.1 iron-containing alcohol dehydrogenase [Rouxiella badensis]